MSSLNKDEKKIEYNFNKRLPPRNYRKAISNPIIEIADRKLAEYEMKLTQSLPAEIVHRSDYLREPYNMEKRINECLVEALSSFTQVDSDALSSIRVSSASKKGEPVEPVPQRICTMRKTKRNRKFNSIETPTLISDQQYKRIIPIDEYPLYKILNEAISDLAGLMSLSILKRPIKTSRRSSLKHSLSVPEEEITPLMAQEIDNTASQSQQLSKSFHLYLKALPPSISKRLEKKCSLWKLQSKGRQSLSTSMSVNVTSDAKEDTLAEKPVNPDDEEATVHVHPSNQTKLVKVLMRECTADNTMHRTLKKWMFPYRISTKDFPNIHLSNVRNNKYFLQTLTGTDKVMLNRRATMVKLNEFLLTRHLNKVEQRQEHLKDEETKRLRMLKIQGIVNSSYDEDEKPSDNRKVAEKPYIAYNSLRPLFNENPFANCYKTLVKEIHRDVILKEKEEEDVASIGEVSFVSSTSSFERKEFIDDDTVISSKYHSIHKEKSQRISPANGNEFCTEYMNNLNALLKEIDDEERLNFLYEASVPLMKAPPT